MGKWRLKFQFFFLNLSSKVLAGVGVRTSKYPYMDICVIWLFTASNCFSTKAKIFLLSITSVGCRNSHELEALKMQSFIWTHYTLRIALNGVQYILPLYARVISHNMTVPFYCDFFSSCSEKTKYFCPVYEIYLLFKGWFTVGPEYCELWILLAVNTASL